MIVIFGRVLRCTAEVDITRVFSLSTSPTPLLDHIDQIGGKKIDRSTDSVLCRHHFSILQKIPYLIVRILYH